jgi:hypothetical protein
VKHPTHGIKYFSFMINIKIKNKKLFENNTN